MAELLDVSKLNKKIWLVKVPASVAAAWRPLCEAAMNPPQGGGDIDEDDDAAHALGTVRIETPDGGEGKAKGGKPELTLTVAAPVAAPAQPGRPAPPTGQAAPSGAPRAYKLAAVGTGQAAGGLVAALSYKQGAPGAANPDMPTAMRAEGTVDGTFNATPVLGADGQVDAQYCALAKDRSIKASTKSRVVQRFEDSRQNHMSVLASKRAHTLDAKRRIEDVRKTKEDNKRVRADAGVLERELFRLFERTPQWTFQALQAETRQPGPHLKQVLEGIAQLNKLGPLRDQYTLKREYALGGAGAQVDAA
uniref:Transcription initiation factor IIF subunit beta n=1 Tax=Chlamydomonas leiostraca TaxID=1034604 RepID=A0A7S0X1A5_9CHLO|mmetsp:Transcript_9252/g.22920  ORF Transcript_9252/g.22920 Transcript_9252/m.22920 type:complete len:306 (+) Transcript_9252:195-1112(+)|eukprot:CAMPEP_0202869164 /NCGR_PEP_ID=MMETSP1391-20130828/12035_1 /ASSEMBLY_ACC=CAM_ASM_000867 /TAXON_ID=1034604 /ORGANISM="Chlamydomonas leiostraca, Strain SAG 11-49" /LENGTH=305 /DNA_ID=CAMNT_0049549431 /DNA_START=179 /DNA_END=1099 /DNA_ORIENTATION=+